MNVSEAISILEQLGSEEPEEKVDSADVCAALGVLHDEFSDPEARKLISFIGTCCEHLLKLDAVTGWRASYEREARSIELLDALEQLVLDKRGRSWALNA
jgi:hypothetical protein